MDRLSRPGICWWCGRKLRDTAALLFPRRQGRVCCTACVRALDIPGLYFG